LYSTTLTTGPFHGTPDAGRAIAVDPLGYASVAGTLSAFSSFATTGGAFQTSPGSGQEGFVLKLKTGG
jgi:hypothetical protein